MKNNRSPWSQADNLGSHIEKDDGGSLWGILIVGLVGATATTLAVGHLRRFSDCFGVQGAYAKFRSHLEEVAWKKFNRRLQEACEEETERVERIKRMQSVFNREKNKYRRSYESWEYEPDNASHQHFQRDDWYWKTDRSSKNWRTNSRETLRDNTIHPLSQHYSVLGLDRSRARPYTEVEIKTAFRAKAKEFHPDQNHNNKDAAEARFKEVLASYEAIKTERKDMK